MLKRWGLLNQLRATGCPPVGQFRFGAGTVALTGRPTSIDGVEESFCPRRTKLDKLLVDAAVEAGCELRERFTVRELIAEDGCVTGIRGQADGGKLIEERARIVIGADGAHSVVARMTNPLRYDVYQGRTCTTATIGKRLTPASSKYTRATASASTLRPPTTAWECCELAPIA